MFDFIIRGNDIIFKNVTVLYSALLTPISNADNDRIKKYKIRFLIEKDSPRTLDLFDNICKMFNMTNAMLTGTFTVNQSGIKDISSWTSDDQTMLPLYKTHYMFTATSPENTRPELFANEGLPSFVGSHDKVNVVAKIIPWTMKKGGTKLLLFHVKRVVLLEKSNVKETIPDDFLDLAFNGKATSFLQGEIFEELKL